MTETITVYWEPVTSVLGITAYHENIVYTNNAGQMQYVSSYATNASGGPTGASAQFSGIVSAASAATYNGSSAWGTLASESGFTSTGYGYTHEDGVSFTSTSIASGSDLSAAFSCMVQVEAQIDSMNLTYSPLTQNSNSAANSAITSCGYTPPSSTGLLGDHWAPAAGNIIDTSWTNPSTNQAISFDYDSYGDAELWVGTNDGGAWNQMSVIDNYGGTDHATADLYNDGYYELAGGYSSFGASQWGGGYSGYSVYTGGYFGGSSWGGCSWGGSYGGGWYSYWYGS